MRHFGIKKMAYTNFFIRFGVTMVCGITCCYVKIMDALDAIGNFHPCLHLIMF
jgi:hypothetical protein